MVRFVIIATILLCLGLSGCIGGKQPITLINTFNAEETKKALQNGDNTIKGSALLRKRGGGVVTCAGNSVYITPVTPYSKERMTAVYGNDTSGYNPIFMGNSLVNDVPNFYDVAGRESICNAQGFFEFNNVKDGEYFVITTVAWEVQYSQQGGHLMKRVAVNGGETQEIVLTYK